MTSPEYTDRAAERLVRARAFADGEIPASPDGMQIGREIVRDLLSEVKEISRELHAYKRAKQENDERFQLAASKAQRERDAALSELEAAQARLDKAVEARSRLEIQLEDGELSDGYHTHNELYEYRLLYNAHAARGWVAAGYPVVKSWRHSDGEECFGGGWFVVAAELPTGQVTNHYKADGWGLFEVPEAETAFAWDGHTAAEAADRLRAALGLGEEGTDGE